MSDRDLARWLAHIERVHPATIEMGLDRIREVAAALGIRPAFPLITVGGTNGKGSTCAMLEAMLAHGGYRVGCYTSPHLLRFTERIRVERAEAGDAEVADALARVEAARGGISLTYFEFATLAAMLVFESQKIDVAILEVGLGGRLDAVNVFDADCAVLMTVDMDHMDYLGATRESIGAEKAWIFRAGCPAVCGDASPPASVMDHASRVGANLVRIGVDFGYLAQATQWEYWGARGKRTGLPHPALRGGFQLANAASAMAALDAMSETLPLPMSAIRAGLLDVEHPGRFQVLPGRPLVILDVAHNPQSAAALADNLRRLPPGRVKAVFGMLKDKDIESVANTLRPLVAEWFLAPLGGERGANSSRLEGVFREELALERAKTYGDVASAYAAACEGAAETDKIVVFGSFHTVAAVMALRSSVGRH